MGSHFNKQISRNSMNAIARIKNSMNNRRMREIIRRKRQVQRSVNIISAEKIKRNQARLLLENRLSPKEMRYMFGMVNIATENDYILYDKSRLKEPVLDEKIADRYFYIMDFGKFKMCHPKTITLIQMYKDKPIKHAKKYKMHTMLKKLLSYGNSKEKYKSYEVFHRAMEVDLWGGMNSFYMLLKLNSQFSLDKNNFRDLINGLWFDPNKNKKSYRKWITDLFSGERNRVKYYSDNRFIALLNNQLMINNLQKVQKVREPIKKRALF